MSRERKAQCGDTRRQAHRLASHLRAIVVLRAIAVLLPFVALGCGRDAKEEAQSAGRRGADSVRHASGSQGGAGADAAPTPGFTSAQGMPISGAVPTMASAADIARLAPLPPASLTTAMSTEEQAALRSLPPGPGRALVIGNCLTCHAATMITQQHKDTTGWNKTVTQMIAWGAPLPKDQQPALVAYLAEHYSARTDGPPARQVP